MTALVTMTDDARKAYEAWLEEWNARQKLFVLESEMISGRGLESGGEKGFWDSEGVVAHMELARILNKPGGKYVGVWLINSALTRRPNKCTRTGVSGMSKGLVPEGKNVDRLIEMLDNKIRAYIELSKTVKFGDEEKDRFAWEAHDEIICSEFFKSGNARTARLVYNHVRTVLGMDTHVIRYARGKEYFEKLRLYRTEIFLPSLAAREAALEAEAAQQEAEAAEAERQAKLAREAAINAVIGELGIGLVDVRFDARDSVYTSSRECKILPLRRNLYASPMSRLPGESAYAVSAVAG